MVNDEKGLQLTSGETSNKAARERCGIIMPISQVDTCGEQHWLDVKSIIVDSVSNAGFDAELVSAADDIGVIHKRIIQNLYENPIAVCDISCKNANVMFELGMRLAFDKPTIIIKDDKTSFAFDTAAIEHLVYPRDLRFNTITKFKQDLATKVKATHDKAKVDKNYTTFLKHFGTFTVAKLDTQTVSRDEFVFKAIEELKETLQHNTSMLHQLRRTSFQLNSRPETSRAFIEAVRGIVGDRDGRGVLKSADAEGIVSFLTITRPDLIKEFKSHADCIKAVDEIIS